MIRDTLTALAAKWRTYSMQSTEWPNIAATWSEAASQLEAAIAEQGGEEKTPEQLLAEAPEWPGHEPYIDSYSKTVVYRPVRSDPPRAAAEPTEAAETTRRAIEGYKVEEDARTGELLYSAAQPARVAAEPPPLKETESTSVADPGLPRPVRPPA
jgi:hypothetical protein